MVGDEFWVEKKLSMDLAKMFCLEKIRKSRKNVSHDICLVLWASGYSLSNASAVTFFHVQPRQEDKKTVNISRGTGYRTTACVSANFHYAIFRGICKLHLIVWDKENVCLYAFRLPTISFNSSSHFTAWYIFSNCCHPLTFVMDLIFSYFFQASRANPNSRDGKKIVASFQQTKTI